MIAPTRQREAERKREERKSERIVEIPRPKNLRRRRQLEKDDQKWLRHYCGEIFWYDFTLQQREMIDAIHKAIRFGGDQAIAASRGEGKSTIFEMLLMKYVLSGACSYAVLLAANGVNAASSLGDIRSQIEQNELLNEDYPEVCAPVRALENIPSRAHYMVVKGTRLDDRKKFDDTPCKFQWCRSEIVLPAVPGSPSSGSVIAVRGLDSEVRGLKRMTVVDGRIAVLRPDVACIDDPDTEETVRSEDQALKLETRIDRAIAGLGGQQRSVARVMLTTLQNRTCVSYKYTDPKQKPTWKGKRFSFLLDRPAREDLWEDYVFLREQDLQEGDEFARRAHQFYLDNRAAMDEGAAVANPNRFDAQELPDGSQLEVSALQRYYNEVCRIGADAVSTEYDNNPPLESGPIESGITAHRVYTQLNGYERKMVPPGCTVITQGIDCGKYRLHWVVRAWEPNGTSHVVDYGMQDVHGTVQGTDEGVETAVRAALLERMEQFRDVPYLTPDGEILETLTLVDAGWLGHVIYAVCRHELGVGIVPAIGYGKSAGCAKVTFTPQQKKSPTRMPGDGYFFDKHSLGGNDFVWRLITDADRWKSFEHARWMTNTSSPGCAFVWGTRSSGSQTFSTDEKHHMRYGKHTVAEVEVEEVVDGVLKRYWKAKSDQNHFFDASYMTCVAGAIKGIRILRDDGSAGPQQRAPKNPTPSNAGSQAFLASNR